MKGPSLALILSGGGLRAAIFHLGLIMRLASEDRIEDVAGISTVSGGSLAVGLIFSKNNLTWPSSSEYINKVLPNIQDLLTEKSLQKHSLISALIRPWCWGSSRGNLFAKSLENVWELTGNIKDLPEKPWWLINSTSYETGRNWRFSKHHIGDWKIGHNYTQNIPLSIAIAASAAVPYLIGFVKLKTAAKGWFDIDPATEKPINEKKVQHKSVRLWDGGVYENLGVEGVWKPKGFVDPKIDFMIVSDASAQLEIDMGPATGIFMNRPPFLRSPRLFEIATEQTRSLRSRMIIESVTGTVKLPAAIVRMGRSVDYIDRQAKRNRGSVGSNLFLTPSEVERAAKYPTNVSKIPAKDFKLLLRHGFESADATLTGHAPAVFSQSLLASSSESVGRKYEH